MPPKKRGVKKGKKNVLTRGRTVKKEPSKEEAASATSDTDETASERQNRENSDDDVASTVSSLPTKTNRIAGPNDSDDDDIRPENDKKEPWDDLPDLIEELRGGGDGSITYITTFREHREFELDARKELLQMTFELENMKSVMDTSIQLMRNICPDVKKGKISEAIKALGCPGSFPEFIAKLVNIPNEADDANNPQSNEPIFEESDTEAEDVIGVPFMGSNLQSKKFPSPAKMAKYCTPKQQGPNKIFHFGTNSKGLSSNKAARPAKPGEVIYSERGSPILHRRVPDNNPSQKHERIDVFQPDGTKIEVDMVYRGGQDPNQLRGFKDFANDVRGIAASRATSIRQNRVQPPKIVRTAGAQSASKVKNKPEWR